MDIVMVIQTQYPKLANKERRIADFLLNEQETINNINISVLAQSIGVSNGTITRFCKKIGCNSFTDLKIKLGRVKNGQHTEAADGHINVFAEVYDYYKTVIDQTNQLLSSDQMFEVANMIHKAGRIYIYGAGSSGLTATEFQLRLSRMGFYTQSITDSHLMLINSSILTKNDLVIAISISGQTSNIVNAVEVAKNNQCKVISFTSFPESILAKHSDYCVSVSNALFVGRKQFINSQFSVMYAVDLLSSILLKDKKLNDKMQITVNTILKHTLIK